MPKKAGMEKWKKKRRQEHMEQKLYRYYIFCEGQQTETLYFEGFKKLNKENPKLQYHTAWSNECIEFWFLLHFAYYTANNHRAEYITFLNDKFKELGIGKYQKNMQDIFEILLKHGNPKLAIRYAKRIIKDGAGKTPTEIAPGTKVYELVEELAKYLPEEVSDKIIS